MTGHANQREAQQLLMRMEQSQRECCYHKMNQSMLSALVPANVLSEYCDAPTDRRGPLNGQRNGLGLFHGVSALTVGLVRNSRECDGTKINALENTSVLGKCFQTGKRSTLTGYKRTERPPKMRFQASDNFFLFQKLGRQLITESGSDILCRQ